MALPPLPERPVQNVREELHNYLWRAHRTRSILWLLAVAGIETLVFFLFIASPSVANDPGGFIQVLVFIPFVGILIPYGMIAGTIRKKYFAHVAQLIGFQYETKIPVDSVGGQLFLLGNSVSLHNAFIGSHKGYAMRVYTYTFKNGYGKNAQTRNLQVWEFDTRTLLPTLMVRPKKLLSLLDWSPRDSVPLSLEGNFDTYFRVWIAREMEIEGLVILEPHFMTILIDHYHEFGFTCHENKLYLFTDKPLEENTAAFVSALDKAQHLFDETLPELLQVSRDTAAMRDVLTKRR